MIEAGQIGSIVDAVLPLAQAAAAHRRVESEDRLGAVVLEVAELKLAEQVLSPAVQLTKASGRRQLLGSVDDGGQQQHRARPDGQRPVEWAPRAAAW